MQFSSLIVVASTVAKKTADEEWQEFKKKHGRKHKDAKEEAKRKGHFLKTHRFVEEHNAAKDNTWQAGHNEFSDWAPEELQSLTGFRVDLAEPMRSDVPVYVPNEAVLRQLPTSIDYRNDPCVGMIKWQSYCGSCWAFAATVPLEYQLCKDNNNTYISLSEQQMVNCVPNGCKGGSYFDAWNYIYNTTTGMVDSNTLSYNYWGDFATCQTYETGIVKPTFHYRFEAGDVEGIKRGLSRYGPLAVAMHVPWIFTYYRFGVFDSPGCYYQEWNLNHAMALVGYGTDAESGLDYWIVRNSWGRNWGLDGYVLVRIRGYCGIENRVGLVFAARTA